MVSNAGSITNALVYSPPSTVHYIFQVALRNPSGSAVTLDGARLVNGSNASPLQFGGAFVASAQDYGRQASTKRPAQVQPIAGYCLKSNTDNSAPTLVVGIRPSATKDIGRFACGGNNAIDVDYRTSNGQRYTVAYAIQVTIPNTPTGPPCPTLVQ